MIELRVITVPAYEPDDSGRLHTAYTVHDESAGTLRASAGWTLRDAIECFAKDYKVQRTDILIARPIVPQDKHLRQSGIFM